MPASLDSPARVAVLGAAGRMGRTLIEAVLAAPDLRLAAAIEHERAPELGQDAGLLIGRGAVAVPLTTDWTAGAVDVVIDFTRPEATLAWLPRCRTERVAMVIGTTGFSPEQLGQIDAAAADAAICAAGNFSVGIHLLRRLVEQATRALGPDFDIEIVEAHHRHKVDAPSGTALMLGESAALGRATPLQEVALYAREGHTGARTAGTIGFATLRGGDVVGDHSVHFLGDGERVELHHRASSRMNFARGAVRAAAWLAGRSSGRYSLDDIFG